VANSVGPDKNNLSLSMKRIGDILREIITYLKMFILSNKLFIAELEVLLNKQPRHMTTGAVY
jgi:hypothetical protein